MRLIFNTALTYPKNKSWNLPQTVRVILIVTYALGLRIHETLSITLQDIDVENNTIIDEIKNIKK